VADCVALFSLKHDTHFWNLGRRDYDVNGLWKDTNSQTPTVYRQVGDMFSYSLLVVVLLVLVILII